MRKCTQKKDVQVYSGDGDIIYTDNQEFYIGEGNDCYAKLHNNYGYNLPSKTTMQKVGAYLFYAGGNDKNFKMEDFEVYGLED